MSIKCYQCKELKRYVLSIDDKWLCRDCYESNKKLNKTLQTKLFEI